MAKVTYITPVAKIQGRLFKKELNGGVQRRKTFHDEKGKIIGEGYDESYVIKHPRDYTVQPLQGVQLVNTSIFGRAASIAKMERADKDRLLYWTQRWHKQLRRGEPQAPINPATKKRRIYRRLDIFIQSVIQRELKAGTWHSSIPTEPPATAPTPPEEN